MIGIGLVARRWIWRVRGCRREAAVGDAFGVMTNHFGRKRLLNKDIWSRLQSFSVYAFSILVLI